VDGLRVSRGWKYKQMYDPINDAAYDDGEKNFNANRATIRRWIGGVAPTSAKTLQWIATGWKVPVKTIAEMTEAQRAWRYEQRVKADAAERQVEQSARQLLATLPRADSALYTTVSAPTTAAVPEDQKPGLIGTDHTDAQLLAAWIESSNTSDDAIQYLTVLTLGAARDHTRQPTAPVIANVQRMHRHVQALLQGGRQKLRQSRELFRIDAQLLAHLCLLLGDLRRNDAALAYGAASLLAADEAGSSPAEAFSAQAQIARWRHRYTDAADLAAAGYASSPPTSLRVLLACQEANASALAGDAKRARQALARAEAADVADATESAWTCPPARHALYRLAVALHTGDPSEALHEAAIARAAWAPGKPPPFGTSGHTRIAAGIAYLKLGVVDAAVQQVAPVLELPDQYRLATVTEHMTVFDALLHEPHLRDSSDAEHLREQIAEYVRRGRLHFHTEEQ
jgi:hypothetical protein